MNKSHAQFVIIEKYGLSIANKGVYDNLEKETTQFFTLNYTLHNGEQFTKHISAVDEEHAKWIVYSDHPKGHMKTIKVKSHGQK